MNRARAYPARLQVGLKWVFVAILCLAVVSALIGNFLHTVNIEQAVSRELQAAGALVKNRPIRILGFELDPELCSRVVEVDLSTCDISQSQLSKVGTFFQLEVFLMESHYGNAQYGYWDDAPADLSFLSSCPSVRHVALTGTPLKPEGCAAFAKLGKLQVLYADATQINDDCLKAIGRCKSLIELELCRNPITDLSGLRDLESLQVLHLTSTRVDDEGLAAIASMPKLRVLELSETLVTDRGLSYVANLPDLEELWLDATNVTGTGLPVLDRHERLRRLYLTGTQITDESLAGFPQLKALDEFSARLTKVSTAWVLGNIPVENLSTVGLGGSCTKPERAEFRRRAPNLRIYF